MPLGNRKKNILEDLLSSVLSQFKKYHPSGNLKFNNLDIFQILKLHILIEKILSISLQLNFTKPNLTATEPNVAPFSTAACCREICDIRFG